MKIDLLCNDGSPIGVTPSEIYGKGVGGAELALMTTMQALAARGHDISIFNDPRQGEGVYEGVQYRNLRTYDSSKAVDVLINFRSPNHLVGPRTGAKRLIWWSLDQAVGGGSPVEMAAKADAIVLISPFHKNYMLTTYGTPAEKITVIDCGVRTFEYNGDVERIPGRLIFCSVPDRGLAGVLNAWGVIKAAAPKASLVITADYRLWGCGPGNQNHRLAWAGQPDVEFLGAVPRAELCRLQQQAEIMAYPCIYEELFCIAVAECEVAGAVPVTPAIGAIETTNEFGIVIQGDAYSKEFLATWSKRIIALLGPEHGFLETKRAAMMKLARDRFNMDRIADQWEAVLAGKTT